MSKNLSTNNNEIDLLEFLKILWDGKWFITAFTATAIFVGVLFINSRSEVYESKFKYSVGILPPFYGTDKILTDFRKFFYTRSTFEEWKKII